MTVLWRGGAGVSIGLTGAKSDLEEEEETKGKEREIPDGVGVSAQKR